MPEPGRGRQPWAWAGALLLLGTLAAGLIGAAATLWRYVDVDRLLEAAEDSPPSFERPVAPVALPEPPATREWTAHLYRSAPSAAFFPDTGYHDELVARWTDLVREAGARVRSIAHAAAVDSLPPGATLVMPAALCLDSAERAAVVGHIERGGHLLASWALGARDGGCEWVGYEYLRRLTEAEAAATLEPEPPTYLTAVHGHALTAGLPPGLRIELRAEPWISLRSVGTAAFWSDRSLNPRPAPGGPGGGAATSALATRTKAGGRIAWLGFRLDVGAESRDQRMVDHLARNAALWAGGHVVAEIEPWPGGARSALAVTQDVEHSFKNSRRLAERMAAIDAPVTFFVVSGLASEHPDLADALAGAGELASHSVDHRQMAGRGWASQLAGAMQTRADIEAWSEGAPLGLRPPREAYDSLTLAAWRRAGGRYIAASNGAGSVVPGVFELESGPLVVLPRVVDDDYTVIVARGRTSPDSLAATFLNGLQKMRSLGGLDLLTVHTQLMNSGRRLAAVESAVAAAREMGDVWVAPAAEIADWWLARSELELRMEGRQDGGTVLRLRNGGTSRVTSAWMHVYLPEDRGTYAAPEIGRLIPESHFEQDGLRVRLPALEPRASLEILLPRRSM
ncbi:MAG: polysaccharide deacetylase family protein [Gemmatimonadetes bacterium]|uniref:Polysaccharide deacetylase family protein n=1 Tax=Candidatus Kutchimonas denitrificans TaxID=3056748 RepID=A0AAE4Z4X1_9BACT|nr:polysaccharide deacetylase family protein [Gemmatimonadota bacterium]NIR73835.1 polysaccharide deacetylase family protein [Candidatus Kutchimonas denitrificans]NIS02480.1 polysaccharide deacetylase family protein [Gemmatimonadota bacterium]NIT68348.1 polysaccharide deacetylase family protein [Gemmatimonadota bacterium]NIU51615.1 polysaccharide deacetylase family protein [Gemmatimonadota bacterium]